MKTILIAKTEKPILTLKSAFSQCYQKPADIHVIRRHLKHLSVLEHISFTFETEISRACLAQLTRHRIASYTVQSHRYTKAKFEDLIKFIPKNLKEEVQDHLINTYKLYKKLLEKGVKKEDARLILPQSTAVKVTFTMNLRSLINFWQLRLSANAQEEIRNLAEESLQLVLNELPEIADDIKKLVKGDK